MKRPEPLGCAPLAVIVVLTILWAAVAYVWLR